MHLRIRLERTRRRLSQGHVGGHAGITPEAIGMIETGQRKPSYDVLVKLEDLFGMTHRELFAPAPSTPISQDDSTTKE